MKTAIYQIILFLYACRLRVHYMVDNFTKWVTVKNVNSLNRGFESLKRLKVKMDQ